MADSSVAGASVAGTAVAGTAVASTACSVGGTGSGVPRLFGRRDGGSLRLLFGRDDSGHRRLLGWLGRLLRRLRTPVMANPTTAVLLKSGV